MHLVHGTELCLFSYSILQTKIQICCITLIHTWALSLRSTTRIGPSMSHSQKRLPSHPRGGAMLPPHPLPGLAWLLGLACSCFCYQFAHTSCSHKSYKQFSYNYHMRPRWFYTYLTLWAHDTLHIHIYELWFLFLFFLPVNRQVGWSQPLMSGTTMK